METKEEVTKIPSSTYKIRFNDCDMFGHLNNARYLDYMINARQDHLKDLYGFDYNDYYKKQQGWVITSHEIKYLRPVVFDETVMIRSMLLDVEPDALLVEIQMLDEKGVQLKAILRSRLTFINLRTGRRETHSGEFMDWAQNLVQQDSRPGMTLLERIAELKSQMQAT